MKRAFQLLAGLAISAGALWLTLRGKDLDAIWAATREADYRYLVPYFAIGLAIHLARTVRWGLLLEPVAKVPFGRLNAVAAVGFMGLSVLPFRLGEFARPYLIADRPRLRVSAALSSVVVERVVDGIFMGLILVAALLAVPDSTPGVGLLRTGGVIVSMVFGAMLVFLVVAYLHRERAVRVVSSVLGPLSQRLAARAAGMLDAFIRGLRVVPGRRKLALFFALTVVYWGINAFGMALLARAFGFRLGAIESVALLGVLVVGVMIPAGPGNVGTFQGAIVIGLALFADRDAVATRGTAYANVLWAAQLVQVTALGLFFLFSKHVQIGRLFAAPGEVGHGLEEEEGEFRSGGA